MNCLITAGIGVVAGVSLMVALQGAGVSEPWTAIMAFATVCLAVATYKQTQTSRRALDASQEQIQVSQQALKESLRPFLVWSGYWQLTDGAEDLKKYTFLVKNTGRTPAKITDVKVPPHCKSCELSEHDRLVSPHCEVLVVDATMPCQGPVAVRYEGSTGTPYELLGDLKWIWLTADGKPRVRYKMTPEEKAGP